MTRKSITLGQRLAATARAADRALDRRLAGHGATRSTWRVLQYLVARPAANQRDIARAMGITGATLSHHLHGLEVERLIVRHRDPMDRRSHLVELTDLGHHVLARLQKAGEEHERTLTAALEPADVARLHEVLDRIALKLERDRPDELEEWLEGIAGG
jgi:MarR family transcriptional regulator, transcriptional regulator for hemolysin